MLEAGMQQGSLIRGSRKRGPDVWQFRWADRGPLGKRIYRRRAIGTVCQYADAESARKSIAAPSLVSVKFAQGLGKEWRDDKTRTRDLCRDSGDVIC